MADGKCKICGQKLHLGFCKPELSQEDKTKKAAEENARQVYNIFRGSYDSGVFGQDQSAVAPPHWDDLPYYMRQAFAFIYKNRNCSVESE